MKFMKVLMVAVIVFMIYMITKTSMQSNLFDLMKNWGDRSIDLYPWFSATLYDFYCNTLIFYCWVCYKEKTWLGRIIWLIVLVMWGSPATALYVLIKLLKLKKGEGPVELLTK